MTANQMMTLLALYRGTPIAQIECETTWRIDIPYLQKAGLILVNIIEEWGVSRNRCTVHLTPIGYNFVDSVLDTRLPNKEAST